MTPSCGVPVGAKVLHRSTVAEPGEPGRGGGQRRCHAANGSVKGHGGWKGREGQVRGGGGETTSKKITAFFAHREGGSALPTSRECHRGESPPSVSLRVWRGEWGACNIRSITDKLRKF